MLYFVGHVNSASAPETAAYEEDEAVEKAEEGLADRQRGA